MGKSYKRVKVNERESIFFTMAGTSNKSIQRKRALEWAFALFFFALALVLFLVFLVLINVIRNAHY